MKTIDIPLEEVLAGINIPYPSEVRPIDLKDNTLLRASPEIVKRLGELVNSVSERLKKNKGEWSEDIGSVWLRQNNDLSDLLSKNPEYAKLRVETVCLVIDVFHWVDVEMIYHESSNRIFLRGRVYDLRVEEVYFYESDADGLFSLNQLIDRLQVKLGVKEPVKR